ncbi:MAG: iron-sulfur cluster-binding protein [Deltaproteobacteria bacterium]|uniref:LutB/LldF family L-lactate oxidation iron-sulfur protein n=1 Tax=Desulfobacula sp. TaxID=2593537 RepID=UPI0019A2A2C0|nr:iron-sulfur cluster-binding protein [Candidatus Desulfobacula maris]MBL6992953.1 iron-sulfur cluster-binding protein [Desulfobacula sp.]
MSDIKTEFYKQNAAKAIKDPVLQHALFDVQNRLGPATALAYKNLPEGLGLRLKAHEIRQFAINHLDILLETLALKIQDRGGKVYFAKDAAAATAYCLKVAQVNQVKMVVKGKSMVTEEIGLNKILEANQIEVNETDLGEYIIQLAGETPSHIIAPAIHKTRKEVAQLFTQKLGIPYCEDPPVLTQAARKALRKKFLAADMGLSGCNLACAETGHITTVSNEGNIRMSTTMPKIHMAFMGMERVVARLEDHDALFRLLSRGAAAQNMAGYVSYIGGPRTEDQLDGPDQFHLVILDNGRSRILADPEFREVLLCIRCAACLNVCPAYGKIGGHAYGYPYSGPIGAVITPLFVGINRAKDLCCGEPLCGACKMACPVDIDLPRMLLALRAKLADGDPQWGVTRASRSEKFMFQIWSVIIQNRTLYDLALKAGSIIQRIIPKKNDMIPCMPFVFKGWTKSRDIKPLARASFLTRWKNREQKP